MALIKIYNATDTDFISNNGIKSLQPTKCNIHNEINGEYYADIECNISFAEWLKTDNIIVIDGQGFRLSNPKIVNSKMTFKAYHLSYDSKNYVIQDIQVDNYTVESIANLLNTRIYPTQSLFSISSDITDALDSCKFVYQSLYDCLIALVEASGGFLVRDNWNISIKKSITVDRQKTIALGKNIKTYQSVENWDNVVTTLIPIAQDGSMLENKMLVSDIQYDIPYTKTVTFSSREGVDSSNPPDVLQDLQEQATKYLEEHCIPDVCYTIDSTIGEVVVGETIQLKHNKINQNLITSVYATDYNVLTGKIDKITFGTFYNSASQAFKTKVTDKFISMYRDLQVVDETNKSRFRVLSDSITAEVARSTEADGELSAQVQLTAEGLTAEVNRSTQAEGQLSSQLQLTAEKLSAEVTRSTQAEGNLSSQIQLTAEGLSTKVEKNGVISAINQTSESVRISAQRINLDGYATFTGLADGTTIINGNCIKTGQIDANIIKTGTLDGFTLTGAMVGATRVDVGKETGNHVTMQYGQIFVQNGSAEGVYICPTYMEINGHRVMTTANTIYTSNLYAVLGQSDTYAGTYYLSLTNTSGDTNIPTIGWVKARQSSDERLKHGFNELDIQDKYMQLQPFEYVYNDGIINNKKHFGFKAQDLDKIFNHEAYDLIEYDTDCITENEKKYCNDGVYRINYENLHALDVYMIQQLSKQVENLTKRVDQLEQTEKGVA